MLGAGFGDTALPGRGGVFGGLPPAGRAGKAGRRIRRAFACRRSAGVPRARILFCRGIGDLRAERRRREIALELVGALFWFRGVQADQVLVVLNADVLQQLPAGRTRLFGRRPRLLNAR